MSYATHTNTPRPAALLGALTVPASVGAILIAGLAVHVSIVEPDPNPTGVFITPEPIEPPPPPDRTVEPQNNTAPTAQQDTPQVVPNPRPEITFNPGPSRPIDPFAKLGDDFAISDGLPSVGVDIIPPAPPPPPLDPIAARPRSNPGNWITESDYRPRWIREGMTGVARFTLEIDARGRVTDCAITGSTGHSVLDSATCRLLEKRAKFAPARDGYGDTVAGSFSSSVAWQIPE